MRNPFLRFASMGKNGHFWMGQLSMMLSTILGVYLAANAGFAAATKFEQHNTSRSVYYMLSTLDDEVKDNITEMEALLDTLQKGSSLGYQLKQHRIQTYIWNSMQTSPNIFHIPAKVITGVRRYYTSVKIIRKQADLTNISRAMFLANLEKLTDEIKSSVLPAIQKEQKRIKLELNISLDL